MGRAYHFRGVPCPCWIPTVQVTLARFAGDVDKCLEFLLDTEEGPLGFGGFDWAVVHIQGRLIIEIAFGREEQVNLDVFDDLMYFVEHVFGVIYYMYNYIHKVIRSYKKYGI